MCKARNTTSNIIQNIFPVCYEHMRIRTKWVSYTSKLVQQHNIIHKPIFKLAAKVVEQTAHNVLWTHCNLDYHLNNSDLSHLSIYPFFPTYFRLDHGGNRYLCLSTLYSSSWGILKCSQTREENYFTKFWFCAKVSFYACSKTSKGICPGTIPTGRTNHLSWLRFDVEEQQWRFLIWAI